MQTHYDIALIGGGVTGTASLFALTHFSNAKQVLLIERRQGVAMVNSSSVNNSQTLHTGEMETNFSLEKALKVRAGAELLAGYVERNAPDVCLRLPKMVIGVGEKETMGLTRRFNEFSPHFPHMQLLDREAIGRVEPRVAGGRDPRVALNALYTPSGYAVDYRRMSEALLRDALRSGRADAIFDREVSTISREGKGFRIATSNGAFTARAVIVAAGLSSLNFAHSLGTGLEYALLPVAGSFYRAGHVLNSKVYTVQLPGIPFAAPHGDPAVYDKRETRFGPTAMPLPLIERDHWSTLFGFLKTGALKPRSLLSVLKVLMDRDIFPFALRNAVYDLPWIGKRAFLRSIRKIVPTLEARDLTLNRGAGGMRGQLIDTRNGTLARTDKLMGDGIIFNMAPSPGASFCLGNALEDALTLQRFLGSSFTFNEAGFRAALSLPTRTSFTQRPNGYAASAP